MKKMVIAGGSGFLGKCIADYFSNKDYQIVILTRKHQLDRLGIHHVTWDGKTEGPWVAELEGANVLINLAGKSVDCRYTEANKQLIYHSRIDSTYILGKVVKNLKRPPILWINAASATIYRHAMDRDMDEETGEIGTGFSVDVCQKWESAFNKIKLEQTRKVILRIGIVLGKSNGALQPMKNLVKAGLGGQQGSGKQFVSWLHENDFVRMIQFIIKHPEIRGTYNATSPKPITNHLMMKEIRKAINWPFGISSPKWLLTLGAMFIGTETELILKSRRVVPKKLLDAGFQFQFDNINSALSDLVAQ